MTLVKISLYCILKSLEESGLLIKEDSETIQNEAIRADEGTIRAGQNF